MLCKSFEGLLSDYIDGSLDQGQGLAMAEHAMRCPVCHDLLGEVKKSMRACRSVEVPAPPAELDARILMSTMPEASMTCEQFEQYLTDYLDGFLPARLYHRWERHAALCEACTELPGQVVRSIGACYTYITEELAEPAGLNERILQLTLGTKHAGSMRAPFTTRLAQRLRFLLDPIVSPQLATVATMLLVAVVVLTSTVSADGSISGMYQASLRLARQTYLHGATTAVKSSAISNDVKQIANGFSDFMEGQERQREQPGRPAAGEAETKPARDRQEKPPPSSDEK